MIRGRNGLAGFVGACLLAGCASRQPPGNPGPAPACQELAARWYFVDGSLHVTVLNEGLQEARVNSIVLNPGGSVPDGWAWKAPDTGVPLRAGEVRVLTAAQFTNAASGPFPPCHAPIRIVITCGVGTQEVKLRGWPSSLPPEWQNCGATS